VTAPAVPRDADSAWWWEALDEKRLLLPRCRACGRCFFPPISSCPHCGRPDPERVEASGRGTVYSWVVVHISLDPEFAHEVPYAIVAVDLEEGARMFGRLLGGEAAAGAAVRFAPFHRGGATLPGFELAD
jgi:uncharacterized OB-fold protein